MFTGRGLGGGRQRYKIGLSNLQGGFGEHSPTMINRRLDLFL